MLGDDVIYDGDADAWTMAAYALIARAELQLSEVNGAAAYTAALAAVGMLLDPMQTTCWFLSRLPIPIL